LVEKEGSFCEDPLSPRNGLLFREPVGVDSNVCEERRVIRLFILFTGRGGSFALAIDSSKGTTYIHFQRASFQRVSLRWFASSHIDLDQPNETRPSSTDEAIREVPPAAASRRHAM
jgi:hypothetical protein